MKEAVAGRSKMKVAKNDIIAISNLARLDKAKGNTVINGSIGVFLNEDGSLGKIRTIDDVLKEHICDRLGYPASVGDKEYLDAVERWVFEENHSRIHDLYHVFTGASLGGTGAISASFHLFLDQGETVLLPNIMWNNYMLLAEKAGVAYEKYDLFDENGRFNVKSLRERASACLEKDGRTLVLINDPCQNPTGYCMSGSEYDDLFKMLNEEGRKGQLTVLFDIAYLSYSPFGCKLVDKLAEGKATFLPLVVFSCSKLFGIYGLRVGALIALARSEEEMNLISGGYGAYARGTYSCPVGSASYAISLAMNDDASKKKLLEEIEANRKTLAERGNALMKELDRAHIDHYPYQAGFFLTVKVPNVAYSLCEALKARHIYVVPLSDHEIRIALSGLTTPDCIALVKALKEVL